MPDEDQITQEALEKAPSLKGKYTRKDQHLTPLERAVAEHQGLIGDDGLLKDEAIKDAALSKPLPPGIPAPIPIEALMEGKSVGQIEEGVQAIKGKHAEEAQVDKDLQVDDAGLSPPEEGEIGPGDPTGFSSSDDLADKLKTLITASEEPIRCVHCGWDQRALFDHPPWTDEDKLAFVRHVMSQSGRFFKKYEVFGGRMEITLRSRSQREVDMILACARTDMKNETLVGVGDMTAQLQRYHISAAVHEIIDHAEQGNSKKFPYLEEIAAGKDTASRVKVMDEDVFGSGRSTALYGTVMSSWMEFERLYGWLSSRAHDRDFWKAVVGDRS